MKDILKPYSFPIMEARKNFIVGNEDVAHEIMENVYSKVLGSMIGKKSKIILTKDIPFWIWYENFFFQSQVEYYVDRSKYTLSFEKEHKTVDKVVFTVQYDAFKVLEGLYRESYINLDTLENRVFELMYNETQIFKVKDVRVSKDMFPFNVQEMIEYLDDKFMECCINVFNN